MNSEIRYELKVSEELEDKLGYEFQLGGHYFTMTGSPDSSYRCYLDHPFYGHDKVFKKFSEKYPDEVIMLKGDGQDRKDFWCKYYMNGRVQEEHGKIVYPDFDASKLKKIEPD